MSKEFKCPNCGAPIKINDGDEYGTCEYCGGKFKAPFDIIYAILGGVIALMLIVGAVIVVALS